MATSSVLPAPTPIAIGSLRFDADNPRIAAEGAGTSESAILRTLWRDYAVDEVALSIAANGYFQHEPIFATKDGVVIEGNRRLAAVKLLRSKEAREAVGATDLPKLSGVDLGKLDKLPVIRCTRENLWQYIGFKHINGPQAWKAEAKATYIAWVHDTMNISLDVIARTIGDQHQTVVRLYHAKRVLCQAEEAGVFSVDDRYKQHFSFSHLYTGLGYTGIQEFLGLVGVDLTRQKPVPRRHLTELRDLLVWLYGSKSRKKAPLVKSQNPDLRVLDAVIQTPQGVVALRRGLPLSLAADVSKGDAALFREALQQAKLGLRGALGTLVTGFKGEADLLLTAEELSELAEKLYKDMLEERRPARRARRRTN